MEFLNKQVDIFCTEIFDKVKEGSFFGGSNK